VSGGHALRASFLIGFVGVLSCACSGRVARSELVGTYSAQYWFGDASLRLRSDGRYEQVLRIGGRTASTQGEWSYTEEGDWDIFLLQNCLSATDGAGKLNEHWETPSGAACGPSVTRGFLGFGPIQITDDQEYSHTKVSALAPASVFRPSVSPQARHGVAGMGRALRDGRSRRTSACS
jgi:hypothetical protein